MPTDHLMEPAVYHAGVEAEDALHLAAENFFTPEEREPRECSLKSKEDFERVYHEWLPLRNFEWFAKEIVRRAPNQLVRLHGRCVLCDKEQDFLIQMQDGDVNWLEQVVCPDCQGNARVRFWVGRLAQEGRDGKSLVLERGSNERNWLFHLLGERVNLYWQRTAGQSNKENGKLNTEHLPYDDASLRMVASYDFLETLEDPIPALKEAARVLQPGGKLLLHTLFDANALQTVDRTVRRDGEPFSESGLWYRDPDIQERELSLVWKVFGWDVLDTIRACGFREACCRTHYSINYGYMGYLPLWIEAIR